MDLIATFLSVVSLTLSIPTLRFKGKFSMRRGSQCFWVTAKIVNRFITSHNAWTASDSEGRIMNPSLNLFNISLCVNSIISVVNADTWVPRMMAVSSVFIDQASPTWAGMPYTMYYLIGADTESLATSVNAHRVPHFWE